MKRSVFAIAMLLIATCCFCTAGAQYIPHVKAYFISPLDPPGDPFFYQDTKCGSPGTLDTLIIVARNFGWIVEIDYCIEYPPCIFWIADFNTPITTIGYTWCDHPSGSGGISSVFDPPLNSNPQVPLGLPLPVVAWVVFQWGTCSNDTPIVVAGHRIYGGPRTKNWISYVYGIGSTSIICPMEIPVEETTWGRIKALY